MKTYNLNILSDLATWDDIMFAFNIIRTIPNSGEITSKDFFCIDRFTIGKHFIFIEYYMEIDGGWQHGHVYNEYEESSLKETFRVSLNHIITLYNSHSKKENGRLQ